MNGYKTKWDIFIIVLALYNCIVLPLELAILPPFMEDNYTFEVVNRVIDVIYFIDIILSFRTTYVNPMTGDEVYDAKKISLRYIYGTFWPDIISTVPFDAMLMGLDKNFLGTKINAKRFALLSCLKLIKILRLARIIEFLKSSDEFKLQLKLTKLFFMLLLYIHLTGCAWIFVTVITSDVSVA
tara:strand:- start:437 stop:985 length:549 start_codon:yes stop_codon:yes gene_type:complete